MHLPGLAVVRWNSIHPAILGHLRKRRGGWWCVRSSWRTILCAAFAEIPHSGRVVARGHPFPPQRVTSHGIVSEYPYFVLAEACGSGITAVENVLFFVFVVIVVIDVGRTFGEALRVDFYRGYLQGRTIRRDGSHADGAGSKGGARCGNAAGRGGQGQQRGQCSSRSHSVICCSGLDVSRYSRVSGNPPLQICLNLYCDSLSLLLLLVECSGVRLYKSARIKYSD
jgi:hypothetical protein